MRNLRYKLRVFVRWFLLALLGFHILTGYGITEYRTVEWMTFGLLTKALSFKLHSALVFPLIFFALLHVYLGLNLRWFGKND